MDSLLSEITELYSNIEEMITDYDFCANHQIPDIDFTLYQLLGELHMAQRICNEMVGDELHNIIAQRITELKQQLADYKA